MARKTPRSVTARFGQAVRHQRQEIGVSQEELAARADLHRTYLADIERGTRNPSLVSITKVASGLGIPLSKLIGVMEGISK